MRRATALAGAAAALALGSPAAADEALGRRLAALRALVTPRGAPGHPPSHGAPPCPGARGGSGAATRTRIDAAIRDASLRYGVPAGLVRSVIRAESAFDPRAVSRSGAQGLMQLLPSTARMLGVACPFDPRENVLGGTRYLRSLRDRFGSYERALAAYHAGPTRVAAGRIPRVTRRYVREVLERWRSGRT